MSLHRNDFLVSSHQAELHRHATDARLARTAMAATSTKGKKGDVVTRLVTGLVGAIRPVRRAAADAVKVQPQATVTTGPRP